MKIGTQLKTTRLLLGLTQEQFSAGIVTESYYSRVESNKSNISMDSLLKILNYNQVSLYDFFEPIIREDINQELILAFINLDSKKIEQLDLADGNEQMLAKIMLAILKKNNLNNSKDYQMQLEKYLSIKNQDEIQRAVIDLLLAYLCDIDQLMLIVKKYKKYVFESSKQELTLRIIARIELVAMSLQWSSFSGSYGYAASTNFCTNNFKQTISALTEYFCNGKNEFKLKAQFYGAVLAGYYLGIFAGFKLFEKLGNFCFTLVTIPCAIIAVLIATFPKDSEK